MKLTFNDICNLSALLDKLDIRINLDKLTESLDSAKKDAEKELISADTSDTQALIALGQKAAISIFADLGTTIVRNLHKARKEAVAFISGITSKTEKDVKTMSLKELKDVFVELFKSEDFKDFFKQAEV